MKLNTSFVLLLAAAGFLLLPNMARPDQSDKIIGMPEVLFYSGETPTQFIVVEKRLQRLSLFEQRESVELVKEYVCATGQNPGTKKISGDSRTPEGIYFITEIYADKRITVFGSRAFHLDYPNIFDTHAGHQGDGIFIHGTNKELIPNSTNGCITLSNNDLDELAPSLTVDAIPVIVVDALSEPMQGKDLRLDATGKRFKEILENLSSDVKKIPISDIRTLSFLKQGSQAVASINFTSYDEDRIQFREKFRAYLTQTRTGAWRRIHAVHSQERTPVLLAVHPIKNNLVTNEPSSPVAVKTAPSHPSPPPAAKQPNQLTKGEELLSFVEQWRKAWIAKDIETYINCYSPSFKNGQLDRDGWKTKKLHLNKKYSYINVSIKNIVVEWTNSGASVSFLQTYKSDQYQTTGTKVLELTKRNNRWMIESEIM